MGSIVEHPSLRTLSLEKTTMNMKTGSWNIHDLIHAHADMLAKNIQVDDIQITDSFEDSAVWDAIVVPRLEINIYRKRFLAIQNNQNPATRAAVTARALAQLKSKPLLQWMLLSQNEDHSPQAHLNNTPSTREMPPPAS
jgi:hypothetical protein